MASSIKYYSILALAVGMAASAAIIPTQRRVKTVGSEVGKGAETSSIKPVPQNKATSQCRRISAADISDKRLQLIVEEDFSLFTEGSEEVPGEMFENLMIPDEYTLAPGWSTNGGAPAGGVCALIHPEGGGFLNTPYFDFSGRIYITYRIKAIKGENGKESKPYVFTSLAVGGIDYPRLANDAASATTQLSSNDDWAEVAYEVTFTGYDDQSFIQLNCWTQDKGVLIDDFKVFRDMDFCYPPSQISTSDFVRDGFSAEWTPVSTADSYNYSVIQEKLLSKDNVTEMQDFNDIDTSTGKLVSSDIPEGWDLHLTGDRQVTADEGYDGSPALILANDEDYILLPQRGGSFTDLRFHIRNPKSPEGKDPGYLHIDVINPANGNWNTYAYMSVGAEAYDIVVKDFEDAYPGMYDFAGRFTAVKIYKTKGDGELIIDNLGFTTTPPTERKTVIADQPTDGTHVVISGLDPTAEHYLTVKSVMNDVETEPSMLVHALGISPTVILPPADVDPRGSFTANWEETPRADRYEVRAYNVTTIDSDKRGYEVLTDTFVNAQVGEQYPQNAIPVGNYYEYVSLDEYTDTPGWTGRGNIVCNGMVGCDADETASFEIFSPRLTLSNNNGDYKVYVKAWAEKGTVIIVQGNGCYFPISFSTTGFKEVTLPLNDGLDHDQLMIYSYEGQKFLLDEVAVIQDLKAGDMLYSLYETGNTDTPGYTFMVEPEAKYAYLVRAYQTIFGKTVTSGDSDMEFVTLDVTGVDAIGSDMTQAMTVCGGSRFLEVTLDGSALIEVFNTSGIRVAAVDGHEGRNHIVLEPGIYIVRSQGKSQRVGVRI